jgi:hypothetical protein
MGSRIAAKLADAGHEVHTWDRRGDAAPELDGRVRRASTPAELAARVEVAFSVLVDDDAVREVVLESGLLASLPDRAVFADLSTTSPELVGELARAGAESGVDVLDVEMSGSTPQVESGELVLLVGGEEAVLNRARPVLEALAKTILLIGPHGAGASMKLAVNIALGVEMQAIAEAIAFGEAAGIERGTLLDAFDQLAVVAPAHKPKLENARQDEYPVAFALRLMRKDFELALDRAKEVGIDLPATRASAQACAAAAEAARDDEDFSVVIRLMESQPA